MDVKICDMVGFDLHWWFYGGKINGDVDRRPTDNRVNVGQSAFGWNGRVLQKSGYPSEHADMALFFQIANCQNRILILTSFHKSSFHNAQF